jgi:hypothetical protein
MDDLAWFVESRIRSMGARQRHDLQQLYLGDPRDLHMRVRRRAFASLLYLTLTVPMLGYLGTVAESSGLTTWPEGMGIWALGLLSYLATRYGVPRLRRALHIYAMEWLCFLPPALLWGDAGLRISIRTLGITPTLGILALLGILLVPIIDELPRRTAFLEGALAQGYLRRSLDADNAIWDPGHDFDDPSASQTGCLVLVLIVLGPPLVLAVAETLELSSLQLVGLAMVAAAYLVVRGGVVTQTARLLMFLRLEDRLGRHILIEAGVGYARAADSESGKTQG